MTSILSRFLLLVALVMGSIFFGGCGNAQDKAQHGLNGVARGVRAADATVAQEMRVLRELDLSLAEFSRRQGQLDKVKDYIVHARDALRTAQAAHRAWVVGSDRTSFLRAASCVVAAAGALVSQMAAMGLRVPDGLMSAIVDLGQIAEGACGDG